MRQSKKVTKEHAFSILTLDDDPIMTSTIQAYFQRSGYRVDVENDPLCAIERIRNGHYDILLLDFLMTPICGDQVVAQVRQFNQDIFIILLTGHKSMAPPIKTIRALDIQGYYEKSDRFDQLELLVESCVKSIRQMRTIRNYKDGLSTIIDSIPKIYDLGSKERITDSILHTAMSLLPCSNIALTLEQDSNCCPSSQKGERRFSTKAIGETFSAMTSQEAESTLSQLKDELCLVRDKQMLLPILDGGQHQVGFLSIELNQPPNYDHIQLMEIFARQASSALNNTKLHTLLEEKNQQLDQAYDQLQNSYMEMISTMRRVVDAKDTYTRGHSDRVSYYAFYLARSLGHDPTFCEQARIAGLFHDVGKLSIPDDILLKPGKLTEEELQVIKAHPRSGADLLSVLSQLRPILPAVLSHHERVDGHGYPDGLLGSQIPEMARIIAVVDTFDAMTSDRQYRKALPLRRAVEELNRCKGTQLDGQIVDKFQELILDHTFWSTMRQRMAEHALTHPLPDSTL